ncbi:hypothetical protein HW115_19305 [Verrucomicrobiaceae bacterium N1E253]|uniref:Uncharacterized protein n=1 Tax=Oceaniferula marina TaxID=2748318 RepID=A0A851GRM8_9BACT|nr:hypothetical protein [Oceaniferula marina]NWK57775.1 hypothetical protein [Oceaniferula marina]
MTKIIRLTSRSTRQLVASGPDFSAGLQNRNFNLCATGTSLPVCFTLDKKLNPKLLMKAKFDHSNSALSAITCSAVIAVLFTLLGFYFYGMPYSIFGSSDRPNVDISEASNGMKICIDPSGTELTLTRNGRWVATGVGAIEELEPFLKSEAELSIRQGYAPILRLRIHKDANSSYMQDATRIAERLGYKSVYIAVKRPSKLVQQVAAPDS